MWFTTYPAITPKHRATITGRDTAATPTATGITMGIIHPMDTGNIAQTGAGRGYWRACLDKSLHARQIQCRALPTFSSAIRVGELVALRELRGGHSAHSQVEAQQPSSSTGGAGGSAGEGGGARSLSPII